MRMSSSTRDPTCAHIRRCTSLHSFSRFARLAVSLDLRVGAIWCGICCGSLMKPSDLSSEIVSEIVQISVIVSRFQYV
eukprot:6475475-Prymnesium_polylepis.1